MAAASADPVRGNGGMRTLHTGRSEGPEPAEALQLLVAGAHPADDGQAAQQPLPSGCGASGPVPPGDADQVVGASRRARGTSASPRISHPAHAPVNSASLYRAPPLGPSPRDYLTPCTRAFASSAFSPLRSKPVSLPASAVVRYPPLGSHMIGLLP